MPYPSRNRGGDRTRGTGRLARGWIALVLIGVSVAGAILVFNRDIDWEARSLEFRDLGMAAARGGRHAEARDYFETAIANNPYDWRSHFHLANLLYHRLWDNERALRHYLYCLAYSPDEETGAQAREKADTLRLLMEGALEDPLDALEDMHVAAENGGRAQFERRLSPLLRKDIEAYWQAWTTRGRGSVTYRDIFNLQNGFYDATVELDFADGTSMSMHLLCPIRDIWRLELSFP